MKTRSCLPAGPRPLSGILLLVTVDLLAACVSVQVEPLTQERYAARTPGRPIPMLETEPVRPHIKLARVIATSEDASEDRLREKVLSRAAQLGADAVVLGKSDVIEAMGPGPAYQSTMDATGVSSSWFGGWWSPFYLDPWTYVQSSSDQVRWTLYLSGIAIRYQDDETRASPGVGPPARMTIRSSSWRRSGEPDSAERLSGATVMPIAWENSRRSKPDGASEPARVEFDDDSGLEGWLGVEGKFLTDEILVLLRPPVSGGFLVEGVRPGSPAAEAGLKSGGVELQLHGLSWVVDGDVIVALEQQPVPTPVAFFAAMNALKPGQPVRIEFLRRGERRRVEAVVRERPPRTRSARSPAEAATDGRRYDLPWTGVLGRVSF